MLGVLGLSILCASTRDLGRRQLQGAESDEKLLFIEDGKFIDRRTLLEAELSFTASERDGVDHVFLLSPGSTGPPPEPTVVLQVW
jgi:hypothetical protein